jgi:hypothetical protein
MSAGIVDQITLECLMNRDLYKKLMTNKTVIAQKNKEKDFYKNRISHLTEELLANNQVDGLFVDVSFAFENYVKTCIHYFKIIDESDIIQNDYNGFAGQEDADTTIDVSKDVDVDLDLDSDENDTNSLVNRDEDLDEEVDIDGQVDEEEVDLDEDIYVEVLEDEEDNDNNALKDDDKMKMMMHSARMMTGTLDKFMMLKPPPTITPTKKCTDVLPTQKEINLEHPLLMNKGICKNKNMSNKYGK